MRYAKFDIDGSLLFLATDVPGLDLTGLVPVSDDADPNNLFFDGEVAGPRSEIVLNCDRTVLVNDGKDKATVSGLPKQCVLVIDGERRRVTGPSVDLTTQGSMIRVEVTGAHYGSALFIRAASADVLLDEVRAARDVLLTASDWTQMPDAVLTEEQKEAWRNYRTALRNITSDQPNANIDRVIWPTKP